MSETTKYDCRKEFRFTRKEEKKEQYSIFFFFVLTETSSPTIAASAEPRDPTSTNHPFQRNSSDSTFFFYNSCKL